jgi:ParB-like chromosome segregation protein Spo0J
MRTDHDLTAHPLPLGQLVEHPDNARRGNVDAIANSLQAHGQFAPIVVQRSTGYVIKGNHTVRAARQLGWDSLSAVTLDVDDDQAKRILLADNRTSDLGVYDETSLTDLLASLGGDLSGTGYDDGDLDARLAALAVEDTQGVSAHEELEGWAGKDARTVLLTYTVAEHARLSDLLDVLCERFDVDSYSAVVKRLVEEATVDA